MISAKVVASFLSEDADPPRPAPGGAQNHAVAMGARDAFLALPAHGPDIPFAGGDGAARGRRAARERRAARGHRGPLLEDLGRG
jgi:hypothetical protein